MAPKRKIMLAKNSNNKLIRTETALENCKRSSGNENNVHDVFKNQISAHIENMETITKLALRKKDFDYKKLNKEKEHMNLMKLLADANNDLLEQKMNTLKGELKMQEEKQIEESHKNKQLLENMNENLENQKTEYNKVKINLIIANKRLVKKDEIIAHLKKDLTTCGEQIGKSKQNIDLLEQKVASVQIENQVLIKSIQDKANERELISKENENLEMALKTTAKQLVEKDESITSLQLDLVNYDEQIMELKQVVEQFEKKVSTVEMEKIALIKSLEDKDVEIERIVKENDEMNEKAMNLQNDLNKHIKEMQDLDINQKIKNKKNRKLKKKYERLIYAFEKNKEIKIANLKAIIQESENKISILQKELETKVEENEKNSAHIEHQEKEIKSLKKKCEAEKSENHRSSKAEEEMQHTKDVEEKKETITEKLGKEKIEEIRGKIKNHHEQKQIQPVTEFTKQICDFEGDKTIEEDPVKKHEDKKEVQDKTTRKLDHRSDPDIKSKTTSVILIENLSSLMPVREVIKRLRRIGTLLEYWFER